MRSGLLTRRHVLTGGAAVAAGGLLKLASTSRAQDQQGFPPEGGAAAAPVLREVAPDVFVWTDTCNVYVLRDGNRALLIDLGDGSVLDALAGIGVEQLEWVLFTHHHREQCQGAGRLRGTGVKTACGSSERVFFEDPLAFRKMRPQLGDAHTVHGASYVRPPLERVAIDQQFARMDQFEWRGHEFVCVQTGGHSPGHMAYLLRRASGWFAFTGDLMCADARMQSWYDSEFDYGFCKGLNELANGAAQIRGYAPALLLPSHGQEVRDAAAELDRYVVKLRHLGDLSLRGYDIDRVNEADQDKVSQPTSVPHLWQVSKHLFKFRGPKTFVNFHLLLAPNGHGMLVDCGLFDRNFLDQTLELARERLGLEAIDAVFVTHMHGDHALDADHVRRKWGAELWAMEGVADKFERAWDHDLAALLPAYGPNTGLLAFDRVLADGEVVEWQGYRLTCDWMPGQTNHHSCLHGEIDGQRVAFTGDNIHGNPLDPNQGGNEAVVARNGGTLEEGYLHAAEYLRKLQPDLLLGGHSWAIANPAPLIERMGVRMKALREAFNGLSVEDDYRYMFSPYWVRAMPYRVVIAAGGSREFRLEVRNFRARAQEHRVELVLPPGLTAEPAVCAGRIDGAGVESHVVRLEAAAGLRGGLHLIALDITRDGVRHGQLFDVIVWVGDEP
jgi:glyoxylase-like metal-dependent hydrolase (beta-lactamase superfamily II)